MQKQIFIFISIILISRFCFADNKLPHLEKRGDCVQLIVDGRPFLILGGELGNSSASNLDFMKPIWPKLASMNLNTVLVPVYWDLIEPHEGEFDWTLVDGDIDGARRNNLHLIFLWFGSWKNSMSCYVPAWIKTNPQRFPRARLQDGEAMEILSAFENENCQTDARAFAALMKHIRQIDENKRTVIMVQVENEVGMLTDARDYNPAAQKAFKQPVPKELIEYLHKNKDGNLPAASPRGEPPGADWQTVFGKGISTDEIFMAWHYASYINKVAAAGKAQYPLPMYVNAALIRKGYQPGQYPSAGPLPHLFDIWRPAAPEIDFLAPDIYFDFVEWCQKFHQSSSPFFIPETGRDLHSETNIFYVIGSLNAIGFCPFAVESMPNEQKTLITKCYGVLSQLAPVILEKQAANEIAGVILDKENQVQDLNLGEYAIKVSHDWTSKWNKPADDKIWPPAGGIILHINKDEYLIAGTGIIVTFSSHNKGQIAGILNIQEGKFSNGKWIGGRWLSGDESHQGRHLRLPLGSFGIQRIKLYNY